MAIAATIKMVEDDTLPEVRTSLKNSLAPAVGQEYDKRDSDTWAPIDLTGATVTARVLDEVGEVKDTISCIVLDAVNGRIVIGIANAVFKEEAGDYTVEVMIEKAADSSRQTVYDFLKFSVRESSYD